MEVQASEEEAANAPDPPPGDSIVEAQHIAVLCDRDGQLGPPRDVDAGPAIDIASAATAEREDAVAAAAALAMSIAAPVSTSRGGPS